MLRTTVSGSAYIGVFATVIGDAALVRADLEGPTREDLTEELDVPVFPATIGGGSTVGSLVAGNRTGVVTSGQLTEREREELEAHLERPVRALPGTHNAAGNIILTTDAGALIHPDVSAEAVDLVAETLDVPVVKGTLGGVKTVGMAGVATQRGALCHPQASEDELEQIESVLDVPADLGTVNHGAPLVGSGLIATTAGYVVGDRTTGPELGRIEDALGLID